MDGTGRDEGMSDNQRMRTLLECTHCCITLTVETTELVPRDVGQGLAWKRVRRKVGGRGPPVPDSGSAFLGCSCIYEGGGRGSGQVERRVSFVCMCAAQ